MIIFVSNSITKFKSRIIPKDTIICPLEFYNLKNTISTINQINPSSIICENIQIYNLLKPHFNNLEILQNHPSHIYINNQIPQNIFYITITLFSSILFYLISKNTIITLIFYTASFISLVLCYSDTTRWNTNISKLIDL